MTAGADHLGAAHARWSEGLPGLLGPAQAPYNPCTALPVQARSGDAGLGMPARGSGNGEPLDCHSDAAARY